MHETIHGTDCTGTVRQTLRGTVRKTVHGVFFCSNMLVPFRIKNPYSAVLLLC